jgi:hypothetical protein
MGIPAHPKKVKTLLRPYLPGNDVNTLLFGRKDKKDPFNPSALVISNPPNFWSVIFNALDWMD